MTLELRLLGELTVLRDGHALALPASKKTRALLAYLAATARPQLREKLCALLWDGPDDPRAALRWSLTKLRPVVDDAGTPRLIADRERVELVPAGAQIDLAAIRSAIPGGAPAGVPRVSTDALRAVAGRLRGDLLEGLDLPDCYRWDEWCRAEREAVRRLGSAVLATLVDRLRATTPEEALGHARARLALEPLDEAAHGIVIQLFAELGRHPEAHAQYASCARLFERELGRPPSRELERIRMAIGTAAPVELVAPRPEPVAAPLVPLIGRVQERAALAAFVAAARGPVLLFLGDPGIGKTRLLEELTAMVTAAAGQVLHGRGVEAEVVRPYGMWLDALHAAQAGDPFADAAGGDRARLFETVTASLVALAGTGSLVIILDDLQWIDEASAALLHFVSRVLADGSSGRAFSGRAPAAAPRIRIACAARPGELADNPAALRLIRGLARDGSIRQIGLSPLDAADTAALAVAHAPGVDAARVAAESGGHPLFAVEIARALARGETAWASLDALIGERLELLDGAARELVPWAAALSHGFTADLLATITGLPLLELSRAVAELERRAIVRTIGDEWDFVHDLVRAAAYHRVSEPRRRLLHLQIARCLAEQPDRGGELAGEVAHHASLGGDNLLCARASLTAAERCLRVFAPDEAAAVADRGLIHAARLTGLERARLQIAMLKVAVAADTRRLRRAALAADLERAIVDAQASGADAEAAHGFNVLSRIHFQSGDWSTAHSDLTAAVARSRGADQVNQARAIAHAAQCLVLLDREIPKAEALAGEAAELVSGSGAEIPELSFALALIRHHQGDDDAALALLQRTIEIAERSGDHWHRGICFSRAAIIELARGRLESALDHGRSLRAIAMRMGDSGDVACGEVIAAVAQFGLHGGDPAPIETALVTLRAVDAPALLASALTCAGEVELARDQLAAAARHADEAVEAAERSGRPTEIALARALATRIAVIEGRDTTPQVTQLRALAAELLSARARTAIADVLA